MNQFKSAEEAARAAFRMEVRCSLEEATEHFAGRRRWCYPYQPNNSLPGSEAETIEFGDKRTVIEFDNMMPNFHRMVEKRGKIKSFLKRVSRKALFFLIEIH